MYTLLTNLILTAILAGNLAPLQNLEIPTVESLHPNSQSFLLTQDNNSGTCSDAPTPGCGRRDSSSTHG